MQINQKAIDLKNQIINGMFDYMNCGSEDPNFDCGYSQNHINQCERNIDEFLSLITQENIKGNNELILKIVKNTVIQLNKLNNDCNGSLIETDQRENLCELIIFMSNQAGLITNLYDITEEWREW